MDMATDYPADLACSLASGTTESKCPVEAAAEPLLVVNAAVMQGTTAGAMNNFGGHACQGTSTAPDRAYLLPVRAPLASMTLDLSDSAAGTTDFDSIIDVYTVDCTAAIPTYCDDDGGTPGTESLLTRTNVAIGTYTVVIDGFSTGMGAYTLRVSGTYPSGGACDVMSPWFACPAGQACNAGVCQ
jgi:hypothetical protein